jgi:hypothetical protein
VIELSRVDDRIRLLAPAGAAGACARRNQGVAAARGEFVIFLDSDDLLAPHCLAQRVAAMREHPGLAFGVFPCRVFHREPEDTPMLWNADTGESDIDRYLRKDVPWQTASVVWRRDALQHLGPWDEAALSGQDWEFHLRALIRRFAYQRFGTHDTYWRMPESTRESIGNRAHTPEHQQHRAVMVERVVALLEESGQLTQIRRVLSAGQFFLIATTLAAKGEKRDAMSVWTRCRRRGLITIGQYLEGLLFLRFWHRKGLRTRLRARFERTWPPGSLLERSKTQWTTPIRPDDRSAQVNTTGTTTGVDIPGSTQEDLAANGRMGKTVERTA